MVTRAGSCWKKGSSGTGREPARATSRAQQRDGGQWQFGPLRELRGEQAADEIGVDQHAARLTGWPRPASTRFPVRGGSRCRVTSVSRPSVTVAVMYVQWG